MVRSACSGPHMYPHRSALRVDWSGLSVIECYCAAVQFSATPLHAIRQVGLARRETKTHKVVTLIRRGKFNDLCRETQVQTCVRLQLIISSIDQYVFPHKKSVNSEKFSLKRRRARGNEF